MFLTVLEAEIPATITTIHLAALVSHPIMARKCGNGCKVIPASFSIATRSIAHG